MASTSLAVTGLTKKQRDLFAAMPGPLQEISQQAVGLYVKLAQDDVMARWDMGALVKAARSQPEVYGNRAVHNLAAYLGAKKQSLWICERVHTAFKRPALEKMMTKRMPNGEMLTISHLARLSELTGSSDALKTRRAAEEMLFNEGATVLQLSQFINEHLGVLRKVPSTGRSPKPPKDASAGIKEIHHQSDRLAKRIPLWNEPVFQFLGTAGPDQITEKMLEGLLEATKAAQVIQAQYAKLIPRLERARARVEKILAKRVGQEEEAAEPEEAKPSRKAAGASTLPAKISSLKKNKGRRRKKAPAEASISEPDPEEPEEAVEAEESEESEEPEAAEEPVEETYDDDEEAAEPQDEDLAAEGEGSAEDDGEQVEVSAPVSRRWTTPLPLDEDEEGSGEVPSVADRVQNAKRRAGR